MNLYIYPNYHWYGKRSIWTQEEYDYVIDKTKFKKLELKDFLTEIFSDSKYIQERINLFFEGLYL